MEYAEEDYLALSGIQHFVFCRRQWALIDIEQQWQENLRTIEGNILHEKAHNSSLKEKRGDLIISRGMPVFSKSLGISGVCDVVEFRRNENGVKIKGRNQLYLPCPVEYKRGKPKQTDEDVLQLVAQAICLEEMLLCTINEAYLYYGETGHREKVEITVSLRDTVAETIQEMHNFFERRYTPRVKTSKKCKMCSLNNLCLTALNKNMSVSKYIAGMLKEAD